MTEEEALDTKIGKRFLVIEIDDADRSIVCDPDGFQAYELVGIGAWIECLGHELMHEEDEE